MSLSINLRIAGRRVVVVGGGTIARRKIAPLIAAGARVCVIAPAIDGEIRRMLGSEGEFLERPFRPGDLAGAALAFAATGDPAVNAAVASDANAHGVLINDTSASERSDFTTPALHRTGALTFAVDSDGAAPAFVRRVRDELALRFDARYGAALEIAARIRSELREGTSTERHSTLIATLSGIDAEVLAELGDDAVRLARRAASGLRCATRASALATTQTALVTNHLQSAGIASHVVTITTKGDAVQDRSLASIGSESLFVKELELALAQGRADFAVHSAKDLPSLVAPGMTLAAFSERADPRDVFCSEKFASFAALPRGARVGTSSQRRRALLAAMRPDLAFDDIRGNVDTRLRKLRDGEYDAIVLAAAGLERLGIRAAHTVPFSIDELVPAVAQGILAIECRADDRALAALLRTLLNDWSSELAAVAERSLLASIGGGCSLPIGAHAVIDEMGITLHAAIARPDGTGLLRAHCRGDATIRGAAELGVALAGELRDRGAGEIVRAFAAPPSRLDGRLVVLPRTLERPSRIAPALREAGAEVVEVGDAEGAARAIGERAPDMVLVPSSGSARAIAGYLQRLRERGLKPLVAAMGPASSASAGAAGFPPDVVSPSADIPTFVATVHRYLSEHT